MSSILQPPGGAAARVRIAVVGIVQLAVDVELAAAYRRTSICVENRLRQLVAILAWTHEILAPGQPLGHTQKLSSAIAGVDHLKDRADVRYRLVPDKRHAFVRILRRVRRIDPRQIYVMRPVPVVAHQSRIAAERIGRKAVGFAAHIGNARNVGEQPVGEGYGFDARGVDPERNRRRHIGGGRRVAQLRNPRDLQHRAIGKDHPLGILGVGYAQDSASGHDCPRLRDEFLGGDLALDAKRGAVGDGDRLHPRPLGKDDRSLFDDQGAGVERNVVRETQGKGSCALFLHHMEEIGEIADDRVDVVGDRKPRNRRGGNPGLGNGQGIGDARQRASAPGLGKLEVAGAELDLQIFGILMVAARSRRRIMDDYLGRHQITGVVIVGREFGVAAIVVGHPRNEILDLHFKVIVRLVLHEIRIGARICRHRHRRNADSRLWRYGGEGKRL